MYPIREPLNSGYLRVSDIHEIYWEESGNPEGVPVIFLHGGPGAGASAACRGFFNPDRFRIIIIDQRGCGRSRPYACVEDNTTWDLVADIERVREMLGIRTWLVLGQYFVAGLCPNPSRTGKGIGIARYIPVQAV